MATQLKLPSRIQHLINQLDTASQVTPQLAEAWMRTAEIESKDLLLWAYFDHPKEESYGRKTLYETPLIKLSVLSWRVGDMTAIHNHGATQWGAVKVFGDAEHAVMAVRGDRLVTQKREKLATGTVIPVTRQLIHLMGNTGESDFLSLHMYGRNPQPDEEGEGAKLYELDKAELHYTEGGLFFDLPDERIQRIAPGLQGDFPTWIRHQVELLKQLMRKHDSFNKQQFSTTRELAIGQQLFSPETWQRLSFELHERKLEKKTYRDYLNVLAQELQAAAKMQLDLLNFKLVDSPLHLHKAILEDIFTTDCPVLFLKRYLTLLADVLYEKTAILPGKHRPSLLKPVLLETV